jgi:hypothetical protein
MQTAETKMIKKLVVFLTTTCLSSIPSAGFFDKEIKVKNYSCDDKNKIYADSPVIWTFTVQKNSVILKRDFYDEKKLKGSNLSQLDNCIVIDKANWKCGGDVVIAPKGSYTNAEYQVINSKFSYTEGTLFKPQFCKRAQVN